MRVTCMMIGLSLLFGCEVTPPSTQGTEANGPASDAPQETQDPDEVLDSSGSDSSKESTSGKTPTVTEEPTSEPNEASDTEDDVTDSPAVPAITLQTPTSSPGTLATPTFAVTFANGGVLRASDVVTLHKGTSCANAAIATATGITGAQATLTATAALTEGEGDFSVKVTGIDSRASCSITHPNVTLRAARYLYDNSIPTYADSLTLASASTTSVTTAPAISYTADADDGIGSGVAGYEYALGTSTSGSGQTDVIAWTTAPASPFTLSNLNLNVGTTYYVSLRAKDEVGLSSSIFTESFAVTAVVGSDVDYGILGTMASNVFALGDDPTMSQSSSSASALALTLDSGRSYAFRLYQNRALLDLTGCTSQNSYVYVATLDDSLQLDIPEATTARSDVLTCDTSGGTVTVNLSLRISTLWHVSSSATMLRSAPYKLYLGGVSKDGKIVAYSVKGLGKNSRFQVLVKNLETGKLSIASSSDGTIAGAANGDSGIALPGNQVAGLQYGNLSEDGRYVVFTSSATNLVTGVIDGRNHVYRKDLQNPQTPPLVVDSTDSSQTDQTGYVATVGSEGSANASMSPDARFIVFEAQASSFYGLNGRHIYLKDMNAPDQKPKIVSSLDYTKADQTQTFNVDEDLTAGVNNVSRAYASGGNLRNSTVSPDGRYVYFRGNGLSKYMLGNGAGYQVVRRDMTKNVDNSDDFLDSSKNPFILVSSTDSAGVNQTGRATSSTASAVASDDGRYVVYPGVDVIPGPSAVQGIFKDFGTILNDDYTTPVTPKVISSIDPSQADQTGYYADSGLPQNILISRDGRYTIFHSAATNLATGTTGNQLWLWDRQSPNSTPKVLTSLDSTQTLQTGHVGNVSFGLYYMVKDTGKVLFESSSDRFITDAGDWSTGSEFYYKSVTALDVAPERLDPIHDQWFIQKESTGSNVVAAKISGNGRYMVWAEAGVTNFFKGLDSSTTQVYWKDLQNPLTPVKLVSSTSPDSVDQTTHAFNGANGANGLDISDDGGVVVFTSTATNAYTGASGRQIIACKVLTSGHPCIVVSSTDTTAASQTGNISAGTTVESPKVSGDGTFVIWLESTASYGYTNISTKQVFGKSLSTGDEALGPWILSSIAPTTANQSGNLANAAVSAALVNSTGDKIAFTTAATNLCTNCGPSGRTQVYLGDLATLATPTFTMLSSQQPSAADQATPRGNAAAGTALAWSGNDRYIAFLSAATNFGSYTGLPAVAQVYRVDLDNLATAPILVSSSDGTQTAQGSYAAAAATTALAISNDGNRVYFSTPSQNFLASTSGINFRRTWERRIDTGALKLLTYRGGDETQAANIFPAAHCDPTGGGSKGSTPKVAFICSGYDYAPGLSNKQNVFVRTTN